MLKRVFKHKGPLHTQSEGVTFSLYSEEEIKKLSVVEVHTPLAFNALGHPLPGGLYDPAMGPYDHTGMCSTCQQTITYCPGHFGRIELPLPVINPLFSKTLLQIFRLTCLGCHSIVAPAAISYLTIAQLKLISNGFVSEAQDAESIMTDMLTIDKEGKKSMAVKQARNEGAKDKFESYVDSILSKGKIPDKAIMSSKNLETIKHSIVKRLLSYAKMGHKCSSCGLICKNLRIYESRIVYTLASGKSGRKSRRGEEAEEDFDDGQEFLDSVIGKIGIDIEANCGTQKYLTPAEAKDHMRMIWMSNPDFLKYLFPVLTTTSATFPTDLFFIDVVGVPPPKNRAARVVNNMIVENPQNLALRHVVTSCMMLKYVNLALKKGLESLSVEALKALKGIAGATLPEKLEAVWKELQTDVEHMMDRDKNKVSLAVASQMIGLKQIIEKKEGLFRMHMMGKRVDHACRTVITPDPLIHIEEIGVPDVFAKVLTFPTVVTSWNVQYLRKLVLNGPNVHPGALAVENELGQMFRLDPDDETQRKGIANRLIAADKVLDMKEFKGVKTVYRHLMNGDYMLLNRQPSLHRPSIMAHKARVLYGDKVFRLHYANCKHYNADFDGDEMNAHFPQSHIARSEAANLVNVCNHFLVPKDGTPLSGLIQDHVVAGVRLTMRGRFFNRADYHQLVNFALGSKSQHIETEPPTIIKPRLLWSGKQVISTVVKNLVPKGRIPLTLYSKAKIKADEWRQCDAHPWKAGGPIEGDDMSESVVIFRKGVLLCGVLDKVQLGATPYGLIHSFYELYGNEAAGALLTSFSRLMTNFLQWEGFTLGVKDVLVTTKADKQRRHYMEESYEIGPEAASEGVSLPADAPEDLVAEKLEEVHRSMDNKRRAFVDSCYKKILDKLNNEINKSCIPYGLVTIFPYNNLQLLIQSGAKGSAVNAMQISCALGQIALEGKRPPLSVSGKSLPSFKPYDVTPRAGGFIAGRFLTGIRPQEFFFHCMAGREGLIDTAVKTSRSGYLQRCLIKLLEGVVCHYDGTVRDSDGSIIQFLYGEDGLDVCKSQYLKEKQLKFLQDNIKNVLDEKALKRVRAIGDETIIAREKEKIRKWTEANGGPIKKKFTSAFSEFTKDVSKTLNHLHGFNPETGRSVKDERLVQMWQALSPKERKKYERKASSCPDPILSNLRPDCNFSVVSESLERIIDAHCKEEGGEKRFKEVVYYKAMRALCNPGDAVGVLAAQSIGEPSTQMTLNTFHFAGRGEMNVTLGIPRLREILMVASDNIKTPSMDIPIWPHVKRSRAEKLRLKLTSVNLAQVLQNVEVVERIDAASRSRIYRLTFNFLEGSEYAKRFCVKPSHVLNYFERSFIQHRLLPALRRVSKLKKESSIETVKEGKQKGFNGVDEEDGNGEESERRNMFEEQEKHGMGEKHESSDEEVEPEDADATQQIRRARHTEAGYDEPEDEERIPEGDGEDIVNENEESSRLNEPIDIDENDEENLEGAKVFSVSSGSYDSRVSTVVSINDMIIDYDFDRSKEEWCTLTIQMPLAVEKVNVGSILRTVAEKSIIHQVPNITRAFLVDSGDQLTLKTEGINILAMAAYRDLLDLKNVYCNNIHTMARHYGIDAAEKVLVKEMTDVFKAYGIVIDPRHLSLIADFMTFSGTYRPFNRIGIESSASPLQQMSFETVVSFLRDATLTGKYDDLSNPSARLVVGKPVGVGTGIFGLRQKLDF